MVGFLVYYLDAYPKIRIYSCISKAFKNWVPGSSPIRNMKISTQRRVDFIWDFKAALKVDNESLWLEW